MGNLFSDMSKFGIKIDDDMNIFEDEKKKEEAANPGGPAPEVKEEDFLLEKSIKCPLCDSVSKVKCIKSSKVKRLEPDKDLRPRYKGVDANKYGTFVCTTCGYATLKPETPPALPSAQAKLIKEKISMNFDGTSFETDSPIYDYDMAVERYKLALINSVVKKGKISERAYICLRTAWVYRGKGESLDPENPNYKVLLADCQRQEEEFLKNAFDGFLKATMTEDYPMNGMDESTVDFLITNLAVHFKKYEIASKTLGRILTSPQANRRIKDKAFDLKQEIIEEIKKQKGQ